MWLGVLAHHPLSSLCRALNPAGIWSSLEDKDSPLCPGHRSGGAVSRWDRAQRAPECAEGGVRDPCCCGHQGARNWWHCQLQPCQLEVEGVGGFCELQCGGISGTRL